MKPGPSKGQGGRPRKKAGTNVAGKRGYARVTVGKGRGKQVSEHRAKVGLAGTKGVGGPAAKGKTANEVTVDHKDGNKKNNSIRNLVKIRRKRHSALGH